MSKQDNKKQIRKKHYDSKRKIIFKLETSALLVIDMQYYFCNPNSHAYFKDSTNIISNIYQLISVYRQKNHPIIFTRYALLKDESPGSMGRWWRDILYNDNEMSNIITPLHPISNEVVIRKTQYSAFYETNLHQILKKLNITNIVVTGVLTHLCCETTARDAFMRNYDVFFVADATASDKKYLHNASLKTLSDGFATLVSTKEIISWIKEIK